MANPNNLGDLTAVGASNDVACRGRETHIMQFTVSGITAGNTLVVRMEGMVDQFDVVTGFFNLNKMGTDTTIVADGTYGFKSMTPLERIRLNWISQSGTGASITDIIYGGV